MSRLLSLCAGDSKASRSRLRIARIHAQDTENDDGRLLPEAARLLVTTGGDVERARIEGGQRLREILLDLEAERQARLRARSAIHRAGGPVAVAAMATATVLALLWVLSLVLHPSAAPAPEPRIEHIAWVRDGAVSSRQPTLEIQVQGQARPIVTLVRRGARTARLFPPPHARPPTPRSDGTRRVLRLPSRGDGWVLPSDAVLVLVSEASSTPSDLSKRLAALPLLPPWIEGEMPGVKALLVRSISP